VAITVTFFLMAASWFAGLVLIFGSCSRYLNHTLIFFQKVSLIILSQRSEKENARLQEDLQKQKELTLFA